uniref:Phosphatidate cytidylyltransferase, mitochondrial n=1 Tax=Manihot esculenta TaxID=3983 RepID=A0A2C9W6T8_MANES
MEAIEWSGKQEFKGFGLPFFFLSTKTVSVESKFRTFGNFPLVSSTTCMTSSYQETTVIMENGKEAELKSFLEVLPSVEFCCVYGSALHPNNYDKSSMVDYILGVSDPQQWHSENLKLNGDHYASWMVHFGGAKLITEVAEEIGVGVHFNPFITWKGKMLKYGVVRMHDLVQDIMNWKRFYLCGRLQKPENKESNCHFS